MSNSSVWLIGASAMAQDYARVLMALNQPFEVIGRGISSAAQFEKTISRTVRTGGVQANLEISAAPHSAIVAVGVEHLASVTDMLIRAGTKRILLEKPAGLNLEEVALLDRAAEANKATVLIAYNRRFYHSVQQARECIVEDGGLLSMSFEFTEWAHKIAPLEKGSGVKKHWLLGNSTHVIDLAFHLCGRPADWQCWHAGSLDWHPASARFCGAGITDQGIMFSYLSDWQAPGRWGLELMTPHRRLILRPMEQLQSIWLGSVMMGPIEPENSLDKDFKPGLFRQTQAFLERDSSLFCSLSEQVKNVEIYSRMAGYL